MFNHKHFLLKSYLVAFKCLGYILTNKAKVPKGHTRKERTTSCKMSCPLPCLECQQATIPAARTKGRGHSYPLAGEGPVIVFTLASYGIPEQLLWGVMSVLIPNWWYGRDTSQLTTISTHTIVSLRSRDPYQEPRFLSGPAFISHF